MHKPAGQRYSDELLQDTYLKGMDAGFNIGIQIACQVDLERAEGESLSQAIERYITDGLAEFQMSTEEVNNERET